MYDVKEYITNDFLTLDILVIIFIMHWFKWKAHVQILPLYS